MDGLAWSRGLFRRAVDLRLGSVVDLTLPLAVAVIGGAAGFGVFAGWRWAAGYLVLFGGERVWARIRHGGVLRAQANALEQVNGKVAGIVDTLALQLNRSTDRRISHADVHSLCASLLSRIKDHALLAYQLGPDAPLRVTLAVPYASRPNGRVDALRVWCYDSPHPDRRWSTLPMGLPGAPAAFRTGTPQVIADLGAVQLPAGTLRVTRRYASVACVPVVAGGVVGRPMGVVSLDVHRPNFFTPESLKQQLLVNVAPIVNLLALILTMRREEDRYEFDR